MTTPTTPASTPPGDDKAQKDMIKGLFKEALTEWQTEQEQTRTQQQPEEKSFLQKLFG